MVTDGAVHLVTGARGNLGAAVVAVLRARGARVATVDRAEGGTDDEGLLALGGVDLLDPAACARAVAATLDRFGRLDGVAHAAGGFAVAKADEADAAVWERMFRLNLVTTLNVFRAALPPMRGAGRGALVAVGAAAAGRAGAGFGPYAASKTAVLRLVESYAAELGRDGIRVNAVLPGTMDTPQNREAMPNADRSKWVTTAEVAETIAFLLGPASSGVSGAAVPVTGRG